MPSSLRLIRFFLRRRLAVVPFLVLVIAGCEEASVNSEQALKSRSVELFDASVMHEVRLTIDPAEWQRLRDNFESNDYYPADLVLDGQSVRRIGIRSRGDGSRNGEKPGLRLDFERYVDHQEFAGYDSLVLDNLVTDASMLREFLAFPVFEAMGIPAPKEVFARLSLNDAFWGVYTIVEPVDKPFLAQRFGEDKGNLFDYEWVFPYDFSDLGSDPDSYIPSPFEPETNEDDLDPSGLVAFIRTANRATDEDLVQELSAFTDPARLLAYVATENALADSDGFVGQQGTNNFFLYQSGGTGRFAFIPWDKDTSFTSPTWPALYNLDRNVLTARLTANEALRNTYFQELRRAAGFVNPRFLGPRLDAAYALIRADVLADTHKAFDNDVFEAAVAGLRGLISAREADLLQQLAVCCSFPGQP